VLWQFFSAKKAMIDLSLANFTNSSRKMKKNLKNKSKLQRCLLEQETKSMHLMNYTVKKIRFLEKFAQDKFA